MKRISIKVWLLVTMRPERKLVLLFVFCCMVRPSKQSDGAVLVLPRPSNQFDDGHLSHICVLRLWRFFSGQEAPVCYA